VQGERLKAQGLGPRFKGSRLRAKGQRNLPQSIVGKILRQSDIRYEVPYCSDIDSTPASLEPQRSRSTGCGLTFSRDPLKSSGIDYGQKVKNTRP